jgi:hypothetical protein
MLQPGADVFVSAKDTSGHSLQVPIQPTLEHPRPGGWQFVEVALPSLGSLVEIGIQVKARASVSATGSLSFDDIALQDSSEPFRLDVAAETVPPQPEPRELAPRLGVNIHLLRDDPALDRAYAAGFAFVRMDMLWANVERNGRFRFFAYDALLNALDARGLGVLWILDYGHPDHGGSTPRRFQDIAAFGRFAEAAAAHFKGRNVRYEIWNEPNTAQFWTPSPSPLEYAALLREAVASIRRADPAAKVSSGGLSRMDGAFLSRAIDPALASELTAIGIHPYPKEGPESVVPEFAALREWMARALGERVEIWDTEWGYSSADLPKEAPSNGHSETGRKHQAALAVRELLTVWNLGLPLAVYYDLRDDGDDAANQEHNYGLLDAKGNEKPALVAVRNLMSAAHGRSYAGMLQAVPAGIHAMRLDGAADRLFILWTDQPAGRRKIEFPKRDLVSANDIFGKALKQKNGPAETARAEIDALMGPVYLTYPVRPRN